MSIHLLSYAAPALYLLAGLLLARRLLRDDTQVQMASRTPALVAGAAGVALHGLAVFDTAWTGGSLNLALGEAASIAALIVVALFIGLALVRPIENLGVLVFPAAAVLILTAQLWPGREALIAGSQTWLAVHVVVALLAYGLLTLGMVQAMLLLWQERRLRHARPGALLRAMPPLQTMEKLLFLLVAVGFVLLTLTLISGALFSEQLFGRAFVFTHHVVLSLGAWLVFGILLAGHWRHGWRGRSAAHWTLAGFALLILGYFGSRFVMEVLLGR